MARTSCDANGNVLWRITRAGTTILCAHDTLNRLATKTPPSAACPTASAVPSSHAYNKANQQRSDIGGTPPKSVAHLR
jgi:hypothetical protein